MTLSRILFGGINQLSPERGLVLTATSEADNAPVANLLSPRMGRPWISAEKEEEVTLRFHWGGEQVELSYLNLHGVNFTSSATEGRVILYKDFRGTATVRDSGWLDTWYPLQPFGGERWGQFTWTGRPPAVARETFRQSFYFPFLGQPGPRGRELQTVFAVSGEIRLRGLPDSGVFQVAYLEGGKGFQPLHNLSWNQSLSRKDRSVIRKGKVGNKRTTDRGRQGELAIELPHLLEDEALDHLLLLSEWAGKSQPFFVMPSPDDSRYYHAEAGLYTFATEPDLSRRPGLLQGATRFGYFRTPKMRLEEWI